MRKARVAGIEMGGAREVWATRSEWCGAPEEGSHVWGEDREFRTGSFLLCPPENLNLMVKIPPDLRNLGSRRNMSEN